MKCPKCQRANPAEATFCMGCGTNLAALSGPPLKDLSFDEKLSKIQRYLPRGLTEKILSQKERIEGERKQVTVMFCDMEGFTPFVEKFGSEKAYSVMDEIYEVLIHKVHDFEGTVNEMTGDGIMALYGAPIALEDAPQRALRSALAIHHGIAEFNRKRRDIDPIRMRIGLHTGPVVVGSLGNDLRVEFKAVGDTVNLASRMESIAAPGTTYVTDATFKLSQGLFLFEAMGEKVVKGKRSAVPVYKLLSAKESIHRPRLGVERMIYSEMVGREQELDRLEFQVMKAIHGEGSIVNIIGEAGIGKSRLVAELKKREMIKRVFLLEGRAISTGRNLSFYPIIDVFRQWARIEENETGTAALSKIETALRKIIPEEINDVLPFVATLMGMRLSGRYAERVKGIEGAPLERLIRKNVRELLIKATDLIPVVIIAEDLHWADMSSIELMESLFRLVETQRVLFLNLFRPGYEQTGDRIAQTIRETLSRHYVEILLEPLDDRTTEILISNMLNSDGLHHAVIQQILQRVGGNPFFVEEVVRSIIDEGALVPKHGRFVVTEKIRTMAIPNTINDVLMTRIDRLDEKTRDLVKVASVVGRHFFHRVLSEVTGTADDMEARLSYLKEIQLVRERRSKGELEYLFKHALAQEAAYESILPLKRKELHLKVASSIERVFNGRLQDFYGMLAYHYSNADNVEKAEEYLIKAGEGALKSSASNEALHYYQEALDIYLAKHGDEADPEKLSMFHRNIALALYNKGRYAEAVEFFDRALHSYWGKPPKLAISKVFNLLLGLSALVASLYLPSLLFRRTPAQNDIDALDLFFKKLKAFAIVDPKKYFTDSIHFYRKLTKFDLSKCELGLGMFAGACNLFSFTGISFRVSRRILYLIKGRTNKDDIKSFIICEFSETLHNYMEGNWKEIEPYDDDLVNRTLSIGEIYWTSQHLFWHGLPKLYQGDFDTARISISRLNDIFDVYENELSLLLKQLLSTSLLIESGKLHDALIEIDEGISFAERTNQGLSLIHMLSCKARVNIMMGDLEEAEKHIEHAKIIRGGESSPVPWQLSNFYRSQFEYDLYRLEECLRKGNTREVPEYLKKASKSGELMIRQAKKVAQNRTESYKLRGIYFWLINRQKKALKWWCRAIKEGERLSARLELSRTYFEVGKRLLEDISIYEALNEITGEEYLKKAKALFEEMDLQRDLENLERISK